MRRSSKEETRKNAGTPLRTACERVLRYLRLSGYGREGNRIRIYTCRDYPTHWLLGFAVSSLEDPSREYLFATIVAEKETGYIYSFPSRARKPIDSADIASIREGCGRITPADLDQLEAEVREGRSRKG